MEDLIQVLSSTNTIAQVELLPIEVEVFTIVNSFSATTGTDTLVDSRFITLSSGSSWNSYALTIGQLEDTIHTTNLTPLIGSLSGDVVTRISDGTCIIKSTNGPVIEHIYLDMTQQFGQTSNNFSSYIDGTISDKISKNLVSLLSTGRSVNYYSIADNTTGTFQKNLTSWAASMDLTSISVSTDTLGVWDKRSNATLITRRHVIGAKHWNVYYPSYVKAAGWVVGSRIRFCDSDNVIHVRTVMSVVYAGDIAIATLDSDLPAGVATMKVIGDWFVRNRTPINSVIDQYYIGGIAFHMTSQFNCYFALLGSMENSQAQTTTEVINGSSITYDTAQFCKPTSVVSSINPIPGFLSGHMDYYRIASGGDSGNPLMIALSGQPILLWTWWYEAGGPPVWTTGLLDSLIAEADALAGVSTGYTVTVSTNPI